MMKEREDSESSFIGQYLSNDQQKALSVQLQELFGPTKNPEEAAFVEYVHSRGGISAYTMLQFLITCWMYFLFSLSIGILIRYPTAAAVRCEIQALEGHFNDKEIISISSKTRFIGKTSKITCFCQYEDRNYTELLVKHNYSYCEIIRHIKPAPVKTCERIKAFLVMNGEYATSLDMKYINISKERYYGLKCQSYLFRFYYKLVPFFGTISLAIVYGIIGDIYGRKTAILVSYVLLIFGIATSFFHNIWLTFLSRFFITSYPEQIRLVLLLFVERSSPQAIRLLGFVTFIFSQVSMIVASAFYVYLTRLFVACICLIPVPFFLWCMPSDSRWLFFSGNRRKAWLQVAQKDDYPPYLDQLPSAVIKVSLLEHFSFYTKFVFKLRLLKLMVLAFSMTCIYYLEVNNKVDTFQGFLSIYTTVNKNGVFAGMIIVSVLLVFFHTKNVLLFLNIVLTILCIIDFFAYRTIVTSVRSALSFVTLYVIPFWMLEIIPIRQRATAVGIASSTIGLACIFCEHLQFFLVSGSQDHFDIYLLITTIICTLLVAFTPPTSTDLPDLARETVSVKYTNLC